MRYVLILPTLPAFLVGYGYVLLFTILGAAKSWKFDTKTWTLTAVWRDWVTKIWKYSTTLSYGIIFQPGINREKGRILTHEHVHVRQVQDLCTLAFLLGLAGLIVGLVTSSAPAAWLGLGLWLCGPLYQLPNYLTAVLRGGDVYLDTEHERSAYAQTDEPNGMKSWLDRRLGR